MATSPSPRHLVALSGAILVSSHSQPQPLLESVDDRDHRPLGDPQRIGGRVHVLALGDGQEGVELVEGDLRPGPDRGRAGA
jgi:hypothetical protein